MVSFRSIFGCCGSTNIKEVNLAILSIVKFPNPILRQKSQEVVEFNSELRTFVNDMIDTMYDAPGVGLAAIQVGKPIRVLVLDADYRIELTETGLPPRFINKNPRVFVNPAISFRGAREISYEEGCLSVPGVSEKVIRSEEIGIVYQDIQGIKKEETATGFLAVILQHEIDHLNGKLFVDRLTSSKKETIVAQYKKGLLRVKGHSRYKVEL